MDLGHKHPRIIAAMAQHVGLLPRGHRLLEPTHTIHAASARASSSSAASPAGSTALSRRWSPAQEPGGAETPVSSISSARAI